MHPKSFVSNFWGAVQRVREGLIICCFFTAKGGLFLRPTAAF